MFFNISELRLERVWHCNMNELEFRQWLSENNINKKVQSDMVSRLKKFERAINNCDIDEQYRNDKCEYLLSLFSNKGLNDSMSEYSNSGLPVGKYQLSTYKHALKKYIEYLNN